MTDCLYFSQVTGMGQGPERAPGSEQRRTTRSVWSARSLLPLWTSPADPNVPTAPNAPRPSTAPASWRTPYAWRGTHNWAALSQTTTGSGIGLDPPPMADGLI